MKKPFHGLCSLLLASPLALSCGKGGGGSDNDKQDTNNEQYSGAENDNNGGIASFVTEKGAVVDPIVMESLLSHFKFTSSMDPEIIEFLRYDFATLSGWSDNTRQNDFSKLAKLYGLSEVNAKTLADWLMNRITYILPDDGKPIRFAFIVPNESRVYELSVDTSGGAGVAASNVGGGLYSMYLSQESRGVEGLLLNFNETYIPFLSPRTGVMQIGPNFFDDTDRLDVENSDRRGFRTIKSLYRLSVLFHEARHSDGNSQSSTLSFAHLICPNDGSVAEEYEGLPACDAKANGAYNVGAQILRAMAGICDNVCSVREKSVIESIYLDVVSRIMVEDSDANYGDANPEPLLNPIDTRSFEIVPE